MQSKVILTVMVTRQTCATVLLKNSDIGWRTHLCYPLSAIEIRNTVKQ